MYAPLRQQGICLATYLDYWLLLSESEQEAITQTNIVVKHLLDLGFVKNTEKHVVFPSSDCTLPGFMPEFSVFHRPPVSGESESLQGLPHAFPATQIYSFQIMSAFAGAHVVSHPGSTTGPLIHEGFPALGSCPQTGPLAPWLPEMDTGMSNGTAPLAGPGFPDRGRAYGHCLRRKSVGLGRSIQGSICEGSL